MEARSPDGYIQVGAALRYLIHINASQRVFGDGYVLSNIRDLTDNLQRSGMHVSWRLAQNRFADLLRNWGDAEEKTAETIVEEGTNEDQYDTELDRRLRHHKLTPTQAHEVTQSALMVEATVTAESSGMLVYVAREQRYAADKLLDDVGFFMAPGVFAELPEIARLDFSEAGRCIAYEVPTAAAFHLMRGTEAVLRWFHQSVIKRGRKATMWAAIVNELRSRRNGPPKTLLDNLDNLRSNFRNPTQHPEKVYDIQEAQDLLALSLDVVNRMVKYIKPEVSAVDDEPPF